MRSHDPYGWYFRESYHAADSEPSRFGNNARNSRSTLELKRSLLNRTTRHFLVHSLRSHFDDCRIEDHELPKQTLLASTRNALPSAGTTRIVGHFCHRTGVRDEA